MINGGNFYFTTLFCAERGKKWGAYLPRFEYSIEMLTEYCLLFGITKNIKFLYKMIFKLGIDKHSLAWHNKKKGRDLL